MELFAKPTLPGKGVDFEKSPPGVATPGRLEGAGLEASLVVERGLVVGRDAVRVRPVNLALCQTGRRGTVSRSELREMDHITVVGGIVDLTAGCGCPHCRVVHDSCRLHDGLTADLIPAVLIGHVRRHCNGAGADAVGCE